MKCLVIGNPTSGGGRAAAKIQALEGLLRARGHEVEVFLTQAAGDAEVRASELASDLDALVVAGGDGTLNEAVGGLRDSSSVPILQMASGTANIYARELGLPFHPQGLAKILEAGKTRVIDSGRIRTSPDAGDPGPWKKFLLVASSGFDAMVTRDLKEHRRGTLGFMGYVQPFVRVLSTYRPPRLEVTVDHQEVLEGQWAILSNARNYGGLFEVAHQARVDSGVLDLVLFPDARRRAIARAMLDSGLRRMAKRLDVPSRQGKHFRIRCLDPSPAEVEIDGDHFGPTPVEVEVLPASIRALVP